MCFNDNSQNKAQSFILVFAGFGGRMEQWAPVMGFENYEVSDQGRVRNVTTNKILKPCYKSGENDSWYGQLTLTRNGKQHQRLVHRLVAIAFCEQYATGLEIDHIDGDKTNNHYQNLEWVTRSENIARKHRKKQGASIFGSFSL